MRIQKTLIYLISAIAVSFATSCSKDSTIQYDNATMGNITDGRFISDQGNIFNVVDQQCPGQLDTMNRAFIICDVLSRTANGASNEYDVRVNYIVSVLTKEIVPLSEINEDMETEDPLRVEYSWVSGGYMNLFIIFPVKLGSNTAHLINLVHEGKMTDATTSEPIDGTYRFTLRHNAFGDKITGEENVTYILAGSYVSFPLNSFITEEKAQFSIEWVSTNENAEAGLPSERKSLTTTYTTDVFQHTPQTTTTRQLAIIE